MAFEHCAQFAKGRTYRLQQQIKEIAAALTSETKSSAGDKHETGRAMLQLEREKLGAQLAEAEKMQGLMHKVNRTTNTDVAGLGALVITSGANYFIGISAGECKIGDVLVYCISAATPIGKILMGKSSGDSIAFNGKRTTILQMI